jgi:hypothetical protein
LSDCGSAVSGDSSALQNGQLDGSEDIAYHQLTNCKKIARQVALPE